MIAFEVSFIREGRTVYILFGTPFTNAPAAAEIENINLVNTKLSIFPLALGSCGKRSKANVRRDRVD